jgi:hypothetical protein
MMIASWMAVAFALAGSGAAIGAQDGATEHYCVRWNDSGETFCRYSNREECEATVANADAICLSTPDGTRR